MEKLTSYQIDKNDFITLDVSNPITYEIIEQSSIKEGAMTALAGLPAWLSFDSGTQIFSGTAPLSEVNTLYIVKIKATDQ